MTHSKPSPSATPLRILAATASCRLANKKPVANTTLMATGKSAAPPTNATSVPFGITAVSLGAKLPGQLQIAPSVGHATGRVNG
jgi:hypothetical protein